MTVGWSAADGRGQSSEDLQSLYARRFSGAEEARTDVWRVLCQRFFQRWIPPTATVLDVAAGHCEFINNIQGGQRIAVDLNPEVRERAADGVRVLVTRSDELGSLADDSVDRVFISNFFEHVPRDVILSTLVEVHRVLASDGRLMILQPNVRFCAKDYWMFFDHITAVDDRALSEALGATGFDIELNIPRFLPYTTKGRLPSAPWLVRTYLRLPMAWRVFGGQAFMVASPKSAPR